MTAKLIILIIITIITLVVILLSREFLHPHIRQFIPVGSNFNKITFLLLLITCINVGQSLWIYSERTHSSFPIPGDTYRISPRNSTDLNSLSRKIPTLYSIQNLYIALDELTTNPRIYSIGEIIPADAENQSKLYGTVWPSGDIIVAAQVEEEEIKGSLENVKPTRAGTVYATLKKTDDGIDWRIYTAKDDDSTSEIVSFSDVIMGRTVWTFTDTRLLDEATSERLRK